MQCDATQVLTEITDDNAHRIAAQARGERRAAYPHLAFSSRRHCKSSSCKSCFGLALHTARCKVVSSNQMVLMPTVMLRSVSTSTGTSARSSCPKSIESLPVADRVG